MATISTDRMRDDDSSAILGRVVWTPDKVAVDVRHDGWSP